MLTAESEKRIINEIRNVKNELNEKIESEVKRLDKKIENVTRELNEKIEDMRKELNERIEWAEFRIEGLYSILNVRSLRTPMTRVRNLSHRAIPDVSGINSTRFKWTSESLF